MFRNVITDVEESAFGGLTSLSAVYMRNNNISKIPRTAFNVTLPDVIHLEGEKNNHPNNN